MNLTIPARSKPCYKQGPGVFSPEQLSEHRRLRISSWRHIWNARLLVILSSPVIYACVLPFLLLDAAVAVYQLVCFPIYGIPKVRRDDCLVFDRGRNPGFKSTPATGSFCLTEMA